MLSRTQPNSAISTNINAANIRRHAASIYMQKLHSASEMVQCTSSHAVAVKAQLIQRKESMSIEHPFFYCLTLVTYRRKPLRVTFLAFKKSTLIIHLHFNRLSIHPPRAVQARPRTYIIQKIRCLSMILFAPVYAL